MTSASRRCRRCFLGEGGVGLAGARGPRPARAAPGGVGGVGVRARWQSREGAGEGCLRTRGCSLVEVGMSRSWCGGVFRVQRDDMRMGVEWVARWVMGDGSMLIMRVTESVM
jgi:hypothetical protein